MDEQRFSQEIFTRSFFGNTKKYDFIGNVWSIKFSQYVLKACHNNLQSYHVKGKKKWSPSNKGGQMS